MATIGLGIEIWCRDSPTIRRSLEQLFSSLANSISIGNSGTL